MESRFPCSGFTVSLEENIQLYLLTSFQRSMDRFTDQLSELVKELQQQRHLLH